MDYLLLFALIPILWLSKTCLALLSNYRRARQTGLPIVISPIDPLGPIWMLAHRHLIPLVERLPSSWSRWTRYSYIGWAFDDRDNSQKNLGDAFILVNPGKNELLLSEAGAIDAVLSSSKEYPKPTSLYRALEVFGPNVDTIEGNDWKRHRKITNASFNERTHAVVWSEALTQTQQMLSIYLEVGTQGTTSTAKDATIVALHVLTRALFGGKSHAFANELKIQVQDGHTMSYRDALGVILKNVVHAVAIPHRILSLPFLPKRFRVLGQAIHAFNTYVTEMITKERMLISKRDPSASNMISLLVRTSEAAQEDPREGPGQRGLADNEIQGNVFIFSFAGHETTANAMAYCMLLMAVYPEHQEWLSEEINHVLGDRDDVEIWEYNEAFPKLKRCLATMFETVRLYGGISEIPKTTAASTTHLSICDQTYTIPPETIIWCNSAAVHTQSRYWGPDSLVWRPTRWISSPLPSPPKPPTPAAFSAETIQEPKKGSFIPWSAGARVCPGHKFAKVEFVAVMAALFRTARVRPALLKGESVEAARERILKTVEDSRVVVTLQMMRPEGVGVVWTRK